MAYPNARPSRNARVWQRSVRYSLRGCVHDLYNKNLTAPAPHRTPSHEPSVLHVRAGVITYAATAIDTSITATIIATAHHTIVSAVWAFDQSFARSASCLSSAFAHVIHARTALCSMFIF